MMLLVLHIMVNARRLLLDANSSSMSGLAVDVLNLLTVLCSSEPVQMIGIFELSCNIVVNLNSDLFVLSCYHYKFPGVTACTFLIYSVLSS